MELLIQAVLDQWHSGPCAMHADVGFEILKLFAPDLARVNKAERQNEEGDAHLRQQECMRISETRVQASSNW